MRHPIPKKNLESLNFNKYIRPLQNILPNALKLLPRGDRPLQMTFEDQMLVDLKQTTGLAKSQKNWYKSLAPNARDLLREMAREQKNSGGGEIIMTHSL